MNTNTAKLLITVFIVLFSSPSSAHLADAHIGITSGFIHPIFGLDHLLAMLAVGIVSMQLDNQHVFRIPSVFVVMMVVGAILGLNEYSVPYVEIGISLSVVLLGLAIVFLHSHNYVWIVMAFVGYFGFLHGYAHGAEIPESHSPVYYGGGFVVSTVLIHVLGVAIAYWLMNFKSPYSPLKSIGVVISLLGVFLLSKVMF